MGNIRSSQHRKHNRIVSPFSFSPETHLLAPNNAQSPAQPSDTLQAYLEPPGTSGWFFERVSIHYSDTSTEKGQSPETGQSSAWQIAAQENATGLPDHLKTGIENFSGLSLDDVRVHYNSPKPAEVQALAYTQGSEIHVGPGQEQLLAHEAWHVVQQKQGRVQSTLQMNGIAINNDVGLEQEATVMGARSEQGNHSVVHAPAHIPTSSSSEVLQGAFTPNAILASDKEDKYELDKLIISAIDMSKNKRPPTKLGSRQGSHIVAWELKVREWQKIFIGSGDEVLKKLTEEADKDAKADQRKESQAMRQKLLNTLPNLLNASTALPLSEWTKSLGKAIADYIRAYQASDFTVFGGSRTPKGHGEAPALEKLTSWEKAAETGKDLSKEREKVVATAIKLLDIHPSIDPKTKGKGLDDWITALSTLFPKLFEKGWLQKPHDIPTLAQNYSKDALTKAVGGTASTAVPIAASATVPIAASTNTPTTDDEEAESIREPFVVVAKVDTLSGTTKQTFSIDDIKVLMVMIPDERPPTQFRDQGSHTIAWSLARRAWQSYFGAGKSLKQVMKNLEHTLQADAKWEQATKGGESESVSRSNLEKNVSSFETQKLSLPEWTQQLNGWIKEYVEIYQRSHFATFVETNLKTGQSTPTGHGEGTALGKLDLWEAVFEGTKVPIAPDPSGNEVVKTALALLDIGDWEITRKKVAFEELLERWKHDFAKAFPNVFKKYEQDIKDALEELQKSKAKEEGIDPDAPQGPRKRRAVTGGATSAKKQALAGTH